MISALRALAAGVATSLALAGPVQAGCADLPAIGQGNAPVIVFDVRAEQTPTAPALLSIAADGTQTVRLSSGSRSAQMTRDALAALLAELAQLGLSDLSQSALDEATGARVILDGRTSFITVDLPGCHQRLSVQGSSMQLRLHPDSAPLARFREIERRLLAIVTAIQSG
ncbi:hypothetical protein Q4543_18845 [Salipiger sp. 1_MG-2023]|uniref:hypothetical protein n=1 Tax=Salipiger sp. 1_MG-2023 TaxID=3062665 RepID=UPI0026E33FD7|nr:hypothetical protein [Salipiger sp. 1_MG-2023]MDO6587574.1 hypothetical protein [Salipiger sp. 1_MG-2023]